MCTRTVDLSENTLERFSDTIHMYSSPALELQLYLLYDVSICVFGASGRVEGLLDPNLRRSSIALKKALNRPHVPPSSPAGVFCFFFRREVLMFSCFYVVASPTMGLCSPSVEDVISFINKYFKHSLFIYLRDFLH